jgi:hypothetical protein
MPTSPTGNPRPGPQPETDASHSADLPGYGVALYRRSVAPGDAAASSGLLPAELRPDTTALPIFRELPSLHGLQPADLSLIRVRR